MTAYTKTVDEHRFMTFDFSTKAPIGGVISAPAATVKSVLYGPGATTDLTLGTPAINTQTVDVKASAGTNATKYRVSCEVDCDNGEHYEIEQDLLVSASSGVVA